MTRYTKFSNWSAMVLAGTLVLLWNAKAFQADVNSGDWPEVNHDKLGTRCSSLLLINTSKVKNLEKVSKYKFPDKEPSETAPIAIGGVIYVSAAQYTLALDGFDGHAIWTYKWKPRGARATQYLSGRGTSLVPARDRSVGISGGKSK